MNLFQVSLLISMPTTLTLGTMVFLTRPRRRTNQAFFLLTTVVSLWLIFMAIAAFASTAERAAFWIRQCSAAAAFIPVAINTLRVSLLYPEISWRKLLYRSRYWWLSGIAVFFLCNNRFFLISAKLPTEPLKIAEPVYGGLFYAYGAFLIVSLSSLTFLFARDLRRAVGILRAELQFVLLASCCALLFGMLFLFLDNLTGQHEIGQALPLSVIVFNTITAYGLATRRLLDLPVLLSRMIALLLVLLYLSAIYFFVLHGSNWILNHFMNTELPLAHLAATLTVALLMTPMRWRVNRSMDNLLERWSPIDFGNTMKSAGQILNTISTVPELLERFAELVRETLEAAEVRILLADASGFRQKHALPRDLPELKLTPEDPLIAAARGNPVSHPLILNLIQRMRATPELTRTESRMREENVAALAGIRAKGKLIGVMLLGTRKAYRVYGLIEQDIIAGFCDELALALENAKLYTEVRNSRIYNDLLLDYMISGVIAADTTGRITVCNREAVRITGMRPQMLKNQNAGVLPAPLYEVLKQTSETLRETRDRQIVISTRKDKKNHINVGCTPVRGYNGEPLGVLLVLHDLTTIRKLEEQIRRTERMASLGTLAAGMAHEIKNPLVTLKTFTELLPERFDDSEFRASFIELVGHETKRIDRLVNQLLHFARPAEPLLRPVKVQELIRHTLRLLEQPMKQQDIRARSLLQARDDTIMGDPELLEQAFINFFINAIESMTPGGGTISVATITQTDTRENAFNPNGADTGKQISVSISDTGPGIPPENIGHIFDPFYTTKPKGTGLGLSVAHEIIQKHNGKIDVESFSNRGSVFRILFPVFSPEETSS